MHELSICKNMIEIVLKHANERPKEQIKIIHLEIGKLTAIEKTVLLFSFDIIKKNTVFEKTILNIIDIPGKAYCEACQQVIEITSYYQNCALCDNFSLKIISGQELRIKSMEVE